MKAYKLLQNGRLPGELYVSYNASYHQTDFRVKYEEGKIISPIFKDSKLFVFDTLANANFFYEKGAYSLWEVETDVLEVPPFYIKTLKNRNISDYWKNGKLEISDSKLAFPTMAGTRLCKSLQLIKKLK